MKGRTLALCILLAAAQAAAEQPSQASERLFAFHNPIGLNLHHFLYWRAHPHSRQTGEVADWPADLSEAERGAVDRAVAYYEQAFEKQDLLFSDRLYEIKIELAKHDGSDAFAGLELDPEHAAVLEALVSVYRRRLWPSHQAANQRWIEAMEREVERHGEALKGRLAAAYQDDFPATPIRVDVVAEGHWAGAYTTVRPVHVVITSTRPANQGRSGLEIVFHETSHGILGPNGGTPVDKLASEFEKRGERPSRDLWHVLLFYTTGDVLKAYWRDLGEAAYEPYAYAHGLYRGRWAPMLPAMEQDWQPYLDGTITMDDAVQRIVDRLTAPPPASQPVEPGDGG